MSEANKNVMIFKDCNSGEADEVWFLDEEGEGDSFFHNLIHNVERGDTHSFVLEMWTQEQCDKAVNLGKLMSGDLTEEEADKLHSTL